MTSAPALQTATRSLPAARPSGSPRSPRRRRRSWGVAVIVLLVVAGGIVIALLKPSPPTAGYLDPRNPGPYGTHALAALLAQRGQHVTTAQTPAAALAATQADRGGRGVMLVATSPVLLSRPELSLLATATTSILLVEPDAAALSVLAPDVRAIAPALVQPEAPHCGLPGAAAAGAADTGGVLLRAMAPGARRCYPVDGHPSLVRYASGGRTITVLGTGVPLTNQALANRGDASLALNLLRGPQRIVWLAPNPAVVATTPTGGGQKSLFELIPAPAYLVTLQLGIAALLAALWRARRLGRLVSEPLPVLVRASETVEGHGRLYRTRRSSGRAAEVLRAAALHRITSKLSLPANAGADAVCAAVAARTGRDGADVAAILFGPPPRDDAALVALGDDMDALEGEVRST